MHVVDPSAESVDAVLASCGGVLLTGGADVDPLAYGERERHHRVEVAPERDAFELALTRAALERDVPIFAICRGAQVLNVAAGGSLIQDIPSQLRTPIDHSVETPIDALTHDVSIVPGTALASLLAHDIAAAQDVRDATTRPSLPVNSRHHQAVKTVAPGFVVSARAPDGVVEAIERPGARFCLGVQWHPENFWRTGRHAALFKGLVAAAKS